MTATADRAPSPGAAASSGPGRVRRRLIRVVLVEDHRLLAEMLSEALGEEPDLRVVGIARTVADATMLAKLRPDVVLMDYRLPDGTGAQATRAIKVRWPTARVVMLTALDDDETMMESIRAGADGYLTKDRAVAEVVAAVRAAHAGESLLTRSVIVAIAARITVAREHHVELAHIPALTPRELEVLRALATGLSSAEIGARLSVSVNTVRTHIQNLTGKLGAHSKLEAVAIAMRRGLVLPPPSDV